MTMGLGILLLLVLLIIGIPVGYALGLAGVGALFLLVPVQVIQAQMTLIVHETTADFVMLTIPMFVLMAEFMSAGHIAEDMMIACNRALRKINGGLAMAAIMAGTMLAAASGSSTASVASLTRASFPTMRRLGYEPSFALGSLSIAGTLAIMIPPSVAFILYGLMTGASVGKLFIAGIIPGLMTALGYVIAIAFMVWRNPALVATQPEGTPSPSEMTQSGKVWPISVLIILIIFALYSGVATPTEIGAIGATAAMLLSLALRRMTLERFVTAIGNTLRVTAMIVNIIFGAKLFGFFISYTQATDAMLGWIAANNLSSSTVLVLVILVYLFLGTIMDQFAIIVLTAPIVYPLLTKLGYDGIWFGVVLVKTAEIGLVTPPMGLNVFIAASVAKVETRKAFAGVMPFLVVELILLVLLVLFPQLSLFLPSLK